MLGLLLNAFLLLPEFHADDEYAVAQAKGHKGQCQEYQNNCYLSLFSVK
jgi:hypothetical protein